MRFLVDECTGTSVVVRLREAGHDAVAVIRITNGDSGLVPYSFLAYPRTADPTPVETIAFLKRRLAEAGPASPLDTAG